VYYYYYQTLNPTDQLYVQMNSGTDADINDNIFAVPGHH